MTELRVYCDTSGVVSMGDTQRAIVRAKTKKIGRGDSTKAQPMYQLEDLTSHYAGELWVLGMSTYDDCTGLRIMLSSHNPGKPGPRSRDSVMAVTSDGRVVSAATGMGVASVVGGQRPVAAGPSVLSSAHQPAVAANTAAGASNLGGEVGSGEESDAVPFAAMVVSPGRCCDHAKSLSAAYSCPVCMTIVSLWGESSRRRKVLCY